MANISRPDRTRLVIARHPVSDKNADPGVVGGRDAESRVPPEGVVQVGRAGLYFVRHGVVPDAIYASPAVRTRVLAHGLLTMLGRKGLAPAGMEVQENPDLIELYPGVAEGKARPADWVKLPNRDWDEAPSKGGETIRGVAARGLRGLTQIGEAHVGETVFVAGHGELLKCMLAQMARDRGEPESVVTAQLGLKLGHCSLTVIDYYPETGQFEPVVIAHPTQDLSVPLPPQLTT